MIFLEPQLRFLHFLQNHREGLDSILHVFNFFDTATFAIYLTAFIWIGFSWRWGIRFASLMILSGVVNYAAKSFFELPRPEVYDQTITPLICIHGYGFPSGGGQNGFLLGGLLIYYWKNRWAWPLGGLFALTVAFSRIYLGVHFPLDVLGGIALALILLFGFVKILPSIERFAGDHTLPFFLIILFFSGALLLSDSSRIQQFGFASFVTSLGVFLSYRYHLYLNPPKNWKVNLGLGTFAVLICFFLEYLTCASLFIYMTVVGLWITLIASPVCKLLSPSLRN